MREVNQIERPIMLYIRHEIHVNSRILIERLERLKEIRRAIQNVITIPNQTPLQRRQLLGVGRIELLMMNIAYENSIIYLYTNKIFKS